MAEESLHQQRMQILSGVVTSLLEELKAGNGDKDRRRQVEEWMRTLAEKYPEFKIEVGLRDYYLAEATRLRGEFDKAADLTEKLALGRNIETFLDRAAEYDRPISARLPCPSLAMLAVWAASSLTSFMVFRSSSPVAEICLTAAAASLVEAP